LSDNFDRDEDLTFEEHVNKLGALALTLYPSYDTFELRETDKYFFLSLKREEDSSVMMDKRVINVGGRSQLEFFKEIKDKSDETIVARGDSLAALEEQLELLKKKRGN